VAAVAILLLLPTFALAQITATSIRGVIKDPSGAVVPNVNLVLKDAATGIEKTATSNSDGTFIFANLVPGSYRVSATAAGFQTAVFDSVMVNAGRNTDLAIEMKIGATSTTIEVTAAAVQLETTSNAVSSTILNTSIQNLPYNGRDALFFALLMPGAMTSGDPIVDGRYSTFNGLPNASMNITLDGMNNNSQRFKSGGTSLYTFVPARLDAME
jgi:hypothetical protein